MVEVGQAQLITKKNNEIIIIIKNKSANPFFPLETQGSSNTKIPKYKLSRYRQLDCQIQGAKNQ